MRWRVRPKPKRVPGEYPERFVKAWQAATLPTTTPAEAESAVAHLRSKGWSEEKLAEFILPYVPREAEPAAGSEGAAILGTRGGTTFTWAPDERGAAPSSGEQPAAARPGEPSVTLPPDVTRPWLDEHLAQMDRRQLRSVVDELERRGWPPGEVAMAVLPHLMPLLPSEDRRAIVAGLSELGMDGVEIARATRTP